MMTIDKDYHFLLKADSDPGVDAGFEFGIGSEVSVDENGFIPGPTDWAVQDGEDPTNGSTMFGRDRLLGPTWLWQLHVNRTNAEEALETLGRFKTAWHALSIRDTPGAVLPLVYRVGGRERRVFGRPRRFEAPPDNRILSGYVPVSVDFKCVDGYTYDAVEQEVVLQLGQNLADSDQVDSGGGFVFPVTFPVDTLMPTRQLAQILIGGDAPAYPIVRFYGSVIGPKLITDDWVLSLDYSIAAGQWVEIDTRPWRQTVLSSDGASIAGRLGRRQRLSKIAFAPGRFEAKYVGFSSTTSTCSVRWANTHNGL